ncbi:hypothetical protein EV426DRAFT_721408 [Tirmania nivea]|nr:hypothetical protein EV426DRAFT_721408 [Tirmania nivea]
MSFLTNLILFSPLLLIGFVILYILDRAESLRKGAGLSMEQPSPNAEAEAEAEALLSDAATDNTPEGRGGNGGDEEVGDDQPTTTARVEGGGGSECDEGGRAGARSPVSGASGDEGFQLVRVEESEDLNEEEDEGEEDEGEEEDGFEIVNHGGDDDDPSGAAGPSDQGTGGGVGAGGGAGSQQQPPPPPLRRVPKTKTVGAKKAASLARRDQRRAYSEFQRSRALAAAEEARLAEEARAEEAFTERQRRAVAEEEIAARREKERMARLEREKEIERAVKEDLGRLRCLAIASSGEKKVWKIEELAGEIGRSGKWVLEGLEREGLLGVRECVSEGAAGGEGEGAGGKEWEMRMVTGKGYYVVIREREARALFERLDESGGKGMSWAEMGRRLEEVLGLE